MKPRSLRRLCLAFCLTASVVLANTAVEPAPRPGKWVQKHDQLKALAGKGGVDVLFFGDSITEFWQRPAPRGGIRVWTEHFAPLKSADFGISGDRTQHLLWRMDQGELDGLHPKVVVLMIGTNNTGFENKTTTPRNSVPEAIEGVKAVVHELRQKLPDAKILLLGLLPRGQLPDNPQRLQVAEINRAIPGLADGKHVFFLNFGARFVSPDGTISPDLMPDFLHPDEKGYEIFASAIETPIKHLLANQAP